MTGFLLGLSLATAIAAGGVEVRIGRDVPVALVDEVASWGAAVVVLRDPNLDGLELDLRRGQPASDGVLDSLRLDDVSAIQVRLRADRGGRVFAGPIAVAVTPGTPFALAIASLGPLPLRPSIYPQTAVALAIRVPGLVVSLLALAPPGDDLMGLVPARHLSWIGDVLELRIDAFDPTVALQPGLVLSAMAPNPARARQALADLEAAVTKSWGLPFADGEGGVRHAGAPWLIGIRPAWTVRDGWGFIALAPGSLGPQAIVEPTAPAVAAVIAVVIRGPQLRALNDALTKVTLGLEERPRRMLETQLERAHFELAPGEGGLRGRLSIALAPP